MKAPCKPGGCGLDLLERPAPPRLDTAPADLPAFVPPRIEIWLVGGFHEPGDRAAWTVVSRHGGPTHVLRRARLYPFNADGLRAAWTDARRLRNEHGPDRIAFTARVVVTQVPGQPMEVVAAWTLEGPEPVDVGPYSFERGA